MMEPLRPRLGLLGGSSSESKTSRLAALAAKRRQKENAKTPATSGKAAPESTSQTAAAKADPTTVSSDLSPRINNLHISETAKTSEQQTPRVTRERNPLDALILRARPSTFAETLLQSSEPGSSFDDYSRPGSVSRTEAFDFAGPSPDDIVSKAQTGKGSKHRSPEESTSD